MFKNTPYRKIYENGILVNPITKEKPYTQIASQKDGKKIRKSNNRKGNGLVVSKVGVVDFVKYQIIKQITKNKLIVHSVLKN
jgi:hypothetical protein